VLKAPPRVVYAALLARKVKPVMHAPLGQLSLGQLSLSLSPIMTISSFIAQCREQTGAHRSFARALRRRSATVWWRGGAQRSFPV